MENRKSLLVIVLSILYSLSSILTFQVSAAEPVHIPDDFPRFIVPNHQAEMDSIRALFWHHYEPAGPLIPLWDEWMPMSTLWPAVEAKPNQQTMPQRWSAALSSRPMNADGYILTQQHDGLAHAEGWPFPLWTQGGGMGWHFRGTGIGGYDAELVQPDGWVVTGGRGADDVGEKGWQIELTEPGATLQTPDCLFKSSLAPWLRLNWWAAGLDGCKCWLEWTTKNQPEFSNEHRVEFAPAPGNAIPTDGTVETRTMIPMYRLLKWKGAITGIRFHFENTGPAKIVIKSFHTSFDSRQVINNPNFIRGCYHYFMWTRDVEFLRSQMPRIRTAMRYFQREFDTKSRKCVYVTWPGHEGRSGVRWVNGKKKIIAGEGIGGNYWDILPFGGKDALATVYYYDAVIKLAELEEQIAAHPEWNIATGEEAFNPAELRSQANEVREYGRKWFWNKKTGRFGTVDLDEAMHDYGFTFLNNEAVYYGFASDDQAKSIHSWISGQRKVEGDTSQGEDIYHWRFGPRATTKRNLDYYVWGWSAPESVPWGNQVQDGGAVLGFSYHDMMARLITAGPDDVAPRLNEIAKWFDETQLAGGYRKYYEADPSRGTLQGGNVPGGLGVDREFFESILAPQVMLYGFLGLHPTVDGLRIDPKLPKDWPELTVTRIHLHDRIVDITAKQDGTILVKSDDGKNDPIAIQAPAGAKIVQ